MKDKKKLTAYFSEYRILEKLPLQEGVLIYPSLDSWNDFGHKTQFNFVVFGVDGISSMAPRIFRLGFLGSEVQPLAVIHDMLTKKTENWVSASELPQFFSLQFNMEAYRDIVSQYGTELALNILMTLNDLVAVRRNTPAPNWVQEAEKTEAFIFSLTRNSESFFAYFNAKSILAGLSSEDLNAVSSNIKFKFQLAAFSNEHNFDFKFATDGLMPKRIAVLIGKNGVGKSRTLNQLVVAALEGMSTLTGPDGGRPLFSRIIAVSTPGETEATFPPVPTQESRVNYLRLSAALGERADTVGQTLPDVIVQLARHYGAIGDKSRWEIFRTAVSRLLPFNSLYVVPPLRPIATSISPAVMAVMGVVKVEDLRNGSEQRCLEASRQLDRSGNLVRLVGLHYVSLSSGQLSFIRLAAQLCLHIENGSLLLIDEPETHLHPNLVTDLVSMLNKILDLSGSIAIVATHSPYLVREVPGSQVHVIREAENRSIEIVQPRLRTFGADVGAISNFVFGDEIVNRLIEEIESRLRKSPESYPDWKEQLKAELSTEAVMHLNRELGDSKGGFQ